MVQYYFYIVNSMQRLVRGRCAKNNFNEMYIYRHDTYVEEQANPDCNPMFLLESVSTHSLTIVACGAEILS